MVQTLRTMLLALLFGATLISAATAAVLRVKHDAPGPVHDGRTWETAFRTIVDAMEAAGDFADAEEIWVAAGDYIGEVEMKRGVSLYGGFAGTETERNQRAPWVHRSFVDAPGPGAFAIIASNDMIDGFTIGRGGIQCLVNSPTISNNVLQGSGTIFTTGISYRGYAAPRIIDNLITGYGYGIRGAAFPEVVPPPIIVRNVLISNGHGLYLSGNFLVEENQISGGGVGIWARGSGFDPWFQGSSIVRNNIIRDNALVGIEMLDDVRVIGNTLERNGKSDGYGVLMRGKDGLFRNNVVRESRGTALLASVVHGQIDGNLFEGGMQWGAVAVEHSVVQLVNNTIAGNTGWGLVTLNARGLLANNIVAFNTGGVADWIHPQFEPSALSVVHNNVYGNAAGNYQNMGADPTGTDGNISEDPLFVSRATGNYRLTPGSPSIDAGDSSYVTWATDLDGHPRVQGESVDMGAYEWQAGPVITFGDAARALRIWGGMSAGTPADASWLGGGGPVDLVRSVSLLREAVGEIQ
jgi:hypothetical protein